MSVLMWVWWENTATAAAIYCGMDSFTVGHCLLLIK